MSAEPAYGVVMTPPVLLQERRQAGSWRGLIVSLMVHTVLIALAAWLVLEYASSPPPKTPEPTFVLAGGSGATGGAKSVQLRPKPAVPAQLTQRLAVKHSQSELTLPEVRLSQLPGLTSASTRGEGMQVGSHGKFGPGGKGLGTVAGLGQGNLGKAVMGAMIHGQKVAVYLDCSGSMRPYLERVKQEIRQQFPDADVFRFDGTRVVSLGPDVVYGKNFQGKAPWITEAPTQTTENDLTHYGRQVFQKIRRACEQGSLGAWLDHLLWEEYDALVIFSDFQDGFRIYETKPSHEVRLLYSDSYFHPVNHGRAKQYRWEARWLQRFALGRQRQGPKLYLFTVQQEPQPFLLKCVEASGGASTSVSWLRKVKSTLNAR